MKRVKELLDIDKVEAAQVLETVLKAKSKADESKDSDSIVMDTVLDKYSNESNKAVLGALYCCMQSEDFYNDMMNDIGRNMKDLMHRIIG